MVELGPSREDYYTFTAYNTVVTVNPRGEVVARYRKSHLYYTDEVWAQEGPEGFVAHDVTFDGKPNRLGFNEAVRREIAARDGQVTDESIRTTFAICMDLNPYHFLPPSPTSPMSLVEHVLNTDSRLLILSTAWLTHLSSAALAESIGRPDMDTLSYWFGKLMPLINHDKKTTCVFANRCGEEPGRTVPNVLSEEKEGEGGGEGVRYAGSSWVGFLEHGKVRMGRVMGRAEEGVLVVDTEALAMGGGWVVEFGERG
ncbi:MAG: hypothetical protein Q9207_000076 [Kuettlingeria erythrocarpa]